MRKRAARFLIVNADDFGLTLGVNRGIMQAHTKGIVTSASLMVYGPAATEAAAYSLGHSKLSVGLHVDLGEWVYQKGNWQPAYQRVALDDSAAIRTEVSRQLRMFRRLLKKNPTHLDSHQHVHQHRRVRAVLAALSHRLGIPLRAQSPAIHYCGAFYGQTAEGRTLPHAISRLGLRKILKGLPVGLSELSCHPGLDNDVGNGYRHERAREVKALCDPRLRDILTAEAFELRCFADLSEPVLA
jgi:predicted glycoside hydrolase/deacetylase ChbG (UPF0249 family)